MMRALLLILALTACPVQAQTVSSINGMPVPADTLPPMETVGGSAGSQLTYRRGDSVPQRISRTVSGTTGAAGTAAVTWPAMPSVPKLTVTPYVASTSVTLPPSCYPVAGTVTTTGATIKCYVDQTILGLGLLPRAAAVAGVAFDVLVLPGS